MNNIWQGFINYGHYCYKNALGTIIFHHPMQTIEGLVHHNLKLWHFPHDYYACNFTLDTQMTIIWKDKNGKLGTFQNLHTTLAFVHMHAWLVPLLWMTSYREGLSSANYELWISSCINMVHHKLSYYIHDNTCCDHVTSYETIMNMAIFQVHFALEDHSVILLPSMYPKL
jgi:hypothetical protein